MLFLNLDTHWDVNGMELIFQLGERTVLIINNAKVALQIFFQD